MLRRSRAASTSRDELRDILGYFFRIHDPTTLNRQGDDRGTSYRSAIFYTSDAPRRPAEETIAEVDASGKWPERVVTEIAPASEFSAEEPEHQEYSSGTLTAIPATSFVRTGSCHEQNAA